jgi:hypothetical protein
MLSDDGHSAIQAFDEMVNANPLGCYVPTGDNEKYIKAISKAYDSHDIPTVLCTSANGIGKTYSTMEVVCNIILTSQSGWFEGDIFESWKHPKVGWIISTPTSIKDIIEPMLLELLPDDRDVYTCRKDGKAYNQVFEFKNGWVLRLKTYEQDVKEFESVSVGLIVCDEPCPENIWRALISRGRLGCLYLLPMTPLECEPYIIDEIYEHGNVKNGVADGYTVIEATVYGACKVRGVRGFIEKPMIDAQVAKYTDDEREARVYGKFTYFSEKIYKFDELVHVVKPSEFPLTRGYTFHQVVDPAEGRYSATIWYAYNREMDRIVIFAEHPNNNNALFWKLRKPFGYHQANEVEEWIEIENRFDLPLNIHRTIDKYFGFQTRGGSNIATLYLKEGKKHFAKSMRNFSFGKSYNKKTDSDIGEVAFGHSVVQRYLELRADGKAGLLIWDTCFHTINGMKHYVRKRKSKNSDLADGSSKPIEKYKDFPDVIRYGCCDRHPEIEHYWRDGFKRVKLDKPKKRSIPDDPMYWVGYN